MRYLVATKQSQKSNIASYLKKQWMEKWALVEVDDNQVGWLKEQVEQIEPDYEMQVGSTDWRDLGCLANEEVLVVTMGKYINRTNIQYTYELTTRKWEEQSIRKCKAIWLHGYSQLDYIYASDWLEAIEQFENLAILLKRPLIIVQNINSKLPYFKEQSLAKEVVEQYLTRRPTLMVQQNWNRGKDKFSTKYLEPHLSKIMYTSASTYQMQREFKGWLQNQQKGRDIKGKKEDVPRLYQDVFYKQIPLEQKIYIPLYGTLDEQEALKIHTVHIAPQYTILYDKRSVVDRYSEKLKEKVAPYLEQAVVARIPIKRLPIEAQKTYKVIDRPDGYQGRGVYIGIITDEGVDYTHESLRTLDGSTRISGYWIQDEGDKGRYYSSDILNRGLKDQELIPDLSWNAVENDSTAILIWAGASGVQYQSLAKDAQFLVAQIQKAPITIQSIYDGEVSNQAALMPDVLIAARQLLDKAHSDHKPLVLIIPYQTNLSAHNGAGIYERILNELGKEPGCTIVMPVGEEGDKKHHQVFKPEKDRKQCIKLEVLKDTKCLVGELYFKSIPKKDFLNRLELYKLSHPEKRMPIDEAGEYNLEQSIVYTSGLIDDDQNDISRIRFAIKNMSCGVWCIKGLPQMPYENAQVDFYLAEQVFNPNVRCQAASPFGTLGAYAAIEGVISVGGYDEKNDIGLKSCGKGEKRYDAKMPFCVMKGKEKYLCADGKWYDMEGSMVSVGLIAGVIALFYEKSIHNKEMPYANTHRMKQWLLDGLKTELNRMYPDATQGYGILPLEIVAHLVSRIN